MWQQVALIREVCDIICVCNNMIGKLTIVNINVVNVQEWSATFYLLWSLNFMLVTVNFKWEISQTVKVSVFSSWFNSEVGHHCLAVQSSYPKILYYDAPIDFSYFYSSHYFSVIILPCYFLIVDWVYMTNIILWSKIYSLPSSRIFYFNKAQDFNTHLSHLCSG